MRVHLASKALEAELSTDVEWVADQASELRDVAVVVASAAKVGGGGGEGGRQIGPHCLLARALSKDRWMDGRTDGQTDGV